MLHGEAIDCTAEQVNKRGDLEVAPHVMPSIVHQPPRVL